MIPLEEARQHVLGAVQPLEPVEADVADALGCVVAVDVVAREAVPPFDNTAMDGFAVRAADTARAPAELRIVGTIAAGSPPDIVVEGRSAVRIMTGAPMPPGADAVVMVERTTVVADGARVRVEVAASPGDHVRRAGDDLRPGDTVVAAGTAITAAHVGVLASIGIERVTVHRRPVVGVLSTGDELVEGPQPLRPGQIRETNRRALLPLVAAAGAHAVDLGLVADEEGALTDALERAVASCDAVLTTGGVSMGDYDFVKVVLDRIGDMRWMQIAIKPAKPFAFGTVANTPVFGLPGNPVSSVVSFELLARPAIRRMLGHADGALDRLTLRAVADDGLRRHADGKVHFVRVVAEAGADGRLHVRSSGGQGSHQLHALAEANALAAVPDGDGIEPGGDVEVLVLGEVTRRTAQ